MEKNMTERATNPEKRANVVTRIFDAPVEKVWKAWTDPEYIKRWWGPKDFTAPYISIDFRVGGKYLYDMRGAGPDGVVKDWWTAGKHLEIVPMKKIVMSTSFADEKGNPVPASYYGMPGDWPMETKLTVTFEEVEGGKTKLTAREEGIPDTDNMRELARLGWEQQFDKFAESLK